LYKSLRDSKIAGRGHNVIDQSLANGLDGKRVTLFWMCALFTGLIFNYLFHSDIVLGDPDLWWHIVTGQGILASGHVPTTDTYSYTFAGQPWIAKEWLSQVLLAAAYNLGGWNGVILLAAISVSAGLTLFYSELVRSLAPTVALIITIPTAICMIPISTARPHIFTFILVVLFTSRLFRSADEIKPPPFWLLPFVTLWTNLHGSFTFSFVIAAFAFLLLLEKNRLKDRSLMMKWVAFGLLMPIAALINPYGVQPLLVNKTLLSGIDAMKVIVEWMPYNAQESTVFEIALLASLGAIWLSAPRLAISKVLFMLVALHMMLTHIRFVYIYFMLVPLVIAGEIAAQKHGLSMAKYLSQPRDRLEKFLAAKLWPIISAGVIAAGAIYLALAVYRPFLPPVTSSFQNARAYIKEHNLTGHVFNDYNFGGPLIFTGVKTYIDGRADQLFQGDFFKDFISTSEKGSEKTIEKILTTSDVAWTIFAPNHAVSKYMATKPDWKKTYEDKEAVIYERAAP
jgi:hypothetical protein